MWPPNLTHLNLVDYAIVIQQCVYEIRVYDIDELRQCLLHVWCSLEQSLIDDVVDQWPTRLSACVHARGDILNLLYDYQFVLSVVDEL